MIFDSNKRITPAQALKHPYFDGFKLVEKPTINTKHQQMVGSLHAITPTNEAERLKPGSK